MRIAALLPLPSSSVRPVYYSTVIVKTFIRYSVGPRQSLLDDGMYLGFALAPLSRRLKLFFTLSSFIWRAFEVLN